MLKWELDFQKQFSDTHWKNIIYWEYALSLNIAIKELSYKSLYSWHLTLQWFPPVFPVTLNQSWRSGQKGALVYNIRCVCVNLLDILGKWLVRKLGSFWIVIWMPIQSSICWFFSSVKAANKKLLANLITTVSFLLPNIGDQILSLGGKNGKRKTRYIMLMSKLTAIQKFYLGLLQVWHKICVCWPLYVQYYKNNNNCKKMFSHILKML